MISLRWVKPRRLYNRRVCAGIALFCYLTTIFGFPLPAAGPRDGDSSASPNRACGCPVAGPGEACCCIAGTKAAEDEISPPMHSCCAKKQPGPGEPKVSARVRRVSLESKKPSNAGAGLRWVVGVAALRCQGHSTLWINSGAATVPPVPVQAAGAPLDCVGNLPDVRTSACRLPIPPFDPPPRSL
jgi:hypothetical protein